MALYLNNLIKNVWSDFQNVKTDPCVVNNSIPIIWFGDMNAYLRGNKRIITIGLNPSKREFQNNKQSVFSTVLRFPKAGRLTNNKSLANKDIGDYKAAMNDYFRINPYRVWFNHLEGILNILNSSFFDIGVKNRAIHIDACTPVATDPTWGGLCFNEKNKLMYDWDKYLLHFLNYLNPQIVLISTNQDIVNELFGNNWYTHLNSKPFYLRSKIDRNRVIIWGYNNRGIPFSMRNGINIKIEMSKIKKMYNIP